MTPLDVTAAELRDRALVLAHELGVDPAAWFVRVLEEEQRAGVEPDLGASCGSTGSSSGSPAGRISGTRGGSSPTSSVRRSGIAALSADEAVQRGSPGRKHATAAASQPLSHSRLGGAAVLPRSATSRGPISMALPWPRRPSFTSMSTRSTRSRRGVPDSRTRREGRAARDAARLPHRPRVARRCSAAVPRGREGGSQGGHRLRGLRRRRSTRADQGLRAPDTPGGVERGLREPHQASSLGYLEGYYYKPRVDWELLERHAGDRRALGLSLGPRVMRSRKADRRTRAPTSTASCRSSGATRRTSRSRTGSPSSRR